MPHSLSKIQSSGSVGDSTKSALTDVIDNPGSEGKDDC